MGRRNRRRPTLGSIIHRDSSGRKVGFSEPSITGGYVDYDRHGYLVGQTTPDSTGYAHYNRQGKPSGHSESGEYLHNPQDAFFRTGSYQPKKSTPQASPAAAAHTFPDRPAEAECSPDSDLYRSYLKTPRHLFETYEAYLKDACRAKCTGLILLAIFFLLLLRFLVWSISTGFWSHPFWAVLLIGFLLFSFGYEFVETLQSYRHTRQLWEAEKAHASADAQPPEEA